MNSGACTKIPTNSSLKLTTPQPCLVESMRAGKKTQRFTQVRASLRCKTLFLLCGGLASRGGRGWTSIVYVQPREGSDGEDELIRGPIQSGDLLRRWLAYIYSGLGPLLSKLRREGIPQWPIWKGGSSTSNPDKRWSSRAKLLVVTQLGPR